MPSRSASAVISSGLRLKFGKEGSQPRRAERARQSAEAVRHVFAGELSFAERRGELVGLEGVVAPLAGGQIPEGGTGHVAGGPRPVEGEGYGRPAGYGSHLLLPDVVGPAAAVLALAAARDDKG
jgi:hypothetical protein